MLTVSVSRNHRLHDPILTDIGKEQANSLLSDYPNLCPQVIFTSPLTRTLQTTLLGFKKQLRGPNPPKIIVTPLLQECSNAPCDTGSDKKILEKRFNVDGAEKAEFNSHGVELDFSHIDDGVWNSKKGEWESSTKALVIRADKMRKLIKERPETEIAVVSHGGIIISLCLCFLTNRFSLLPDLRQRFFLQC